MSAASIYQHDLAYIHHVGFGAFASQAAPELLRILRRNGLRCGTLLDLGCGSGLWAKVAAQAGFKVIGVDQSSAMIRLARQVAPGAQFHCESLHRFRLPRCDVVTALGESLNYLSRGEYRSSSPLALFTRIAKALRPGGLFILDLMMREGAPMNYRSWRSGDDWAVMFEAAEQRAKGRLTRRIVTFRKIGPRYQRTGELHELQLFRRAEIERALQRAGFSVRIGRLYGAFPLPVRRLAFIARKRIGRVRPTRRAPKVLRKPPGRL